MAGLRKISFLAHSLGGLFARYAISILYSTAMKDASQSAACIAPTTGGSEKLECTSGLGAIAGLEPINFITLATHTLVLEGKIRWVSKSIKLSDTFLFPSKLVLLEAKTTILDFELPSKILV